MFVDADIGTSAVPGALALLGLTGDTTVAASIFEFNTALAGGPWDLVIFGEQNSSAVYTSVEAQLSAYVAGGGRVLGTTYVYWTTSGLAGLLEATYGGISNFTPIFTGAHPIFHGLGASIPLQNSGWGVWSLGWNAAAGAECLGTLDGVCAVVLGNGGRTLLNPNLFDTFADLDQGEQFIANEIDFLLNGAPQEIPEPATFLLIGSGLAGLGLIRRRAGK